MLTCQHTCTTTLSNLSGGLRLVHPLHVCPEAPGLVQGASGMVASFSLTSRGEGDLISQFFLVQKNATCPGSDQGL